MVVWNSDKQDVISGQELINAREDRPWQKHLVWGVESGPNRRVLEEYFDAVRSGHRDQTLDGDMTYFLEGVAPAVYAYDYFNFDQDPQAWEDKRQDRIAAVFVSNCSPRNARNIITEELMRLLPGQIDSFGPCKNNANLEETLHEMGMWDEVGSKTRWNMKVTALRSQPLSFATHRPASPMHKLTRDQWRSAEYKFVFAIENSNDIDYVTEKFFQPSASPFCPPQPPARKTEVTDLAPRSSARSGARRCPDLLWHPALYRALPSHQQRRDRRGPVRLARPDRSLQHTASATGLARQRVTRRAREARRAACVPRE